MDEALVKAVTPLLEADGLKSFTTNPIAERAGVGVASVYRYFADKEAIVAEIDLRNRRENAQWVLSALTAFESDLGAAARVRLDVETAVDWMLRMIFAMLLAPLFHPVDARYSRQ